jgi:hypothetical protein
MAALGRLLPVVTLREFCQPAAFYADLNVRDGQEQTFGCNTQHHETEP